MHPSITVIHSLIHMTYILSLQQHSLFLFSINVLWLRVCWLCFRVADCIVCGPTSHTGEPLSARARPHAALPGAELRVPSLSQRPAHAPAVHPILQLLTLLGSSAGHFWPSGIVAAMATSPSDRGQLACPSSSGPTRGVVVTRMFPLKISTCVSSIYFFITIFIIFRSTRFVSFRFLGVQFGQIWLYFLMPRETCVCVRTSYHTDWTNDLHFLSLVTRDSTTTRHLQGPVIWVWKKHGSITVVKFIFPFHVCVWFWD